MTFQELLRKQRVKKAPNSKRGGYDFSYYNNLENLDNLVSTENEYRAHYEKAVLINTVFPDFWVSDLGSLLR